MNELNERQRHLVEYPEWSLVTCLDPGLLATPLTITNEEDPSVGIQVQPAAAQVPIDLRLENVMMNVAATCFLQFDELANQRLGGKQRFSSANDNLRNTCTILYLVRCAFAHNPLIPTWVIAPPYRNRTYPITAIGLSLDTTNLHKAVGVIPRIGGWVGGIQLLQHAHSLIDTTTASAMRLRAND